MGFKVFIIIFSYAFSILLIDPVLYGQESASDLIVTPNAISKYMYQNYEKITSEITRRNSPFFSVYPCYIPTSYRLIKNYDKENERAWILNLQIGIDSGSGAVGIYRTVILSDAGNEIISLPERKSGDESLVLQLNNDQKMIIVRTNGGKWGSPVKIFLLQPELREIFSIGSPSSSEGWYSTMYFKKFESDANTNILVDKLIIDSNNVRKMERSMLRYDEKSAKYISSIVLSGDQIKDIIRNEGEKLPNIEEYGPPYEDHGKVIDK